MQRKERAVLSNFLKISPLHCSNVLSIKQTDETAVHHGPRSCKLVSGGKSAAQSLMDVSKCWTCLPVPTSPEEDGPSACVMRHSVPPTTRQLFFPLPIWSPLVDSGSLGYNQCLFLLVFQHMAWNLAHSRGSWESSGPAAGLADHSSGAHPLGGHSRELSALPTGASGRELSARNRAWRCSRRSRMSPSAHLWEPPRVVNWGS